MLRAGTVVQHCISKNRFNEKFRFLRRKCRCRHTAEGDGRIVTLLSWYCRGDQLAVASSRQQKTQINDKAVTVAETGPALDTSYLKRTENSPRLGIPPNYGTCVLYDGGGYAIRSWRVYRSSSVTFDLRLCVQVPTCTHEAYDTTLTHTRIEREYHAELPIDLDRVSTFLSRLRPRARPLIFGRAVVSRLARQTYVVQNEFRTVCTTHTNIHKRTVRGGQETQILKKRRKIRRNDLIILIYPPYGNILKKYIIFISNASKVID